MEVPGSTDDAGAVLAADTSPPTSTRPDVDVDVDADGSAEPASTGAQTPGVASTMARLGVVWALGCGAVVSELADHGVNGSRAALVIAIVCAAAIGCLHLEVLTARDRVVSLAALGALGALLTMSTVGRLPLPFALASTLIADVAMFGDFTTTPRTRHASPASLGVVFVGAAAVSWGAELGNLASLALLAAAVTMVALHRTTPVGRIDRWLSAPVAAVWSFVAAGLGSGADALAGGTRRAASRAGTALRTAGRSVGRIGESLRSLAGGAGRAIRRLAATVASATAGALAVVGRAVRTALDPRHRPILASSVFVAVITAPIFRRLVAEPFIRIRGTNDVPGTLERVEWMNLWPPRLPVPHPGWSVAVKLTSPLIGEIAAVTTILAVATGSATAILITIGRSRWDHRPPLVWPLACAMGIGWVLMENPAIFASRSGGLWSRFVEGGTHARGQGFLPLHQWGTPTITMSMPFVFALFALLLLTLSDVEEHSDRLGRHRKALLVLTIVSTLVQPATTLALVPALPLYLLFSGRLSRRMAENAGWYFMVPGTAVVLGQVWFLASKVSPWEQATWVWRPLWSWSYFGMDRPVYWATALFFVVCLWAGGRRYLSDPAVALSLIALGVSLMPFLFFEQTGIYEPEGDLGVPALMAMILLFVSSLRFILLELQGVWERRARSGAPPPLWSLAAGLVMVAMFCAGVVDLLSAAGVIEEL